MDESPPLMPCDPVHVARRLKAVRDAMGMSKASMADMMLVDRSSYVKIESGAKPLQAHMAYRLYELYGVDMNFLYLGQVGGLPLNLSSKVMSRLNATAE